MELREPVVSMIREKFKEQISEDESTDAENRVCSSEEVSVMEMERRDLVLIILSTVMGGINE